MAEESTRTEETQENETSSLETPQGGRQVENQKVAEEQAPKPTEKKEKICQILKI